MWIYRNIGTRKHSHKRNGFIYFKRTRQFSVCQLPCNNNQKKRILQHINNMQNNTNTNRHTHTQKDLRKWIFIIGFCVCCVVSPIFYDYNSIGISFVFFFCFLCGDIEKSSYSAFSITIVCVCVWIRAYPSQSPGMCVIRTYVITQATFRKTFTNITWIRYQKQAQ